VIRAIDGFALSIDHAAMLDDHSFVSTSTYRAVNKFSRIYLNHRIDKFVSVFDIPLHLER